MTAAAARALFFSPDLRAVVLMLLMRMITNEMYLGDRTQDKVVLIDEAWDLMSEGSSGQFIEKALPPRA